jgi:DNA polymerase-4
MDVLHLSSTAGQSGTSPAVAVRAALVVSLRGETKHARRRSAMPSHGDEISELIFVTPRLIPIAPCRPRLEIFAEHTDMIEPLSLDEDYLDVTVNKQSKSRQIAMIRARIKVTRRRISYCQFLARMAYVSKTEWSGGDHAAHGANLRQWYSKKFHGWVSGTEEDAAPQHQTGTTSRRIRSTSCRHFESGFRYYRFRGESMRRPVGQMYGSLWARRTLRLGI